LGALCVSQNIVINDRHRAKGDAEATVILFEKLLLLDTENVFNSFLNPRSKQSTLPPLLPKKTVDELSENSGVYYFKNEKNEIIYVGKAKNIKQRVLSHFYDKAKKEITMCLETSHVSCVETGSELLALLLESSEIKSIYPKYNRAQRRAQESVGLFAYEDRDGIIHLAYNRLKLVTSPLMKFSNITECRIFLEKLCEDFELCPKYCHLQTNVSTCFHYQIKKCKGVCKEEESVELYNLRVQEAIDSLKFKSENFIIKETGRTSSEYAYVLVLNGIYKGFGYANKKQKITSAEDYFGMLSAQKENNDVRRILNSYVNRNSASIVALDYVSTPFELNFS
jgi:DNA polymerase-3 subunit epsilon